MIPRKNNPNKRQNAITGIPIMPIPILPTIVNAKSSFGHFHAQ